jgi:hypothetical protein
MVIKRPKAPPSVQPIEPVPIPRVPEEISLAAAEARIEVLEAHITYYQGMWKAQKVETKRYADLYMDRCEKWSALREENERLREALHAGADKLDALRS